MLFRVNAGQVGMQHKPVCFFPNVHGRGPVSHNVWLIGALQQALSKSSSCSSLAEQPSERAGR